jgi:hypothetical protein
MAAAPSRIGHAHPAPFMVNTILPSADLAKRKSCQTQAARNDRGPRGPAAFKRRRTVRRRAAAPPWGRRQASRRVRIAGIQGGRRFSPCSCRTSGTVVGLQNSSMGAPCQAGALLAPPASVIDRLEVVDSDCHQGARRNGSLRYPLFYIFIIALRCPESRRELRVK